MVTIALLFIACASGFMSIVLGMIFEDIKTDESAALASGLSLISVIAAFCAGVSYGTV